MAEDIRDPVTDPITALHDALVPLLRPYFAENRWVIEPVPYPMSLDEFKRLMRATPWIGITWRSFEPGQRNGRTLLGGEHQVQLTICVKNPSLAGRYRGDRAGPGLYPVLSTAAVILHGQTLNEHGTLLVTGVQQAYADGYGDQSIAIGIVTLSCQSALGDVVRAVAQAPAFTALVSSFELDATETPIATDTIALPGLPAEPEDAP